MGFLLMISGIRLGLVIAPLSNPVLPFFFGLIATAVGWVLLIAFGIGPSRLSHL